ncbi:MAG: hypothetical protein WD768_17985 [Phycisphaeraceae bacterium]
MPSAITSTSKRFGTAIGALALLMGGIWIAVHGGPLPESPEATDKFFIVVFQCIGALPKLGPLWLGALGLGIVLRKWLAPHAKNPVTVQIVAGLGAMLMLDWLLAVMGWLNAWTAWAILGAGTAVITYHFADPKTRDDWHPDNWPNPPWTVLLALPVLGILLAACICPPGTLWSVEAFGYDVMSYHLQLPSEWMLRGSMAPLEHNVYSYLPSLAEAGYFKLAIMHGSVYDAIYTAQLFHASVAVVAAVALGKFVGRTTGPVPAAIAGAALLAMPWTLITASLAYNEMFVLAFGAGAMLLVFDPAGRTVRGAILIGMCLGLSMMAKLTAAGLIVLPLGAVLVMRWLEPRPEGRGPNDAQRAEGDESAHDRPVARTLPGGAPAKRLFPALALGLLLILTPYLVRNALWTGNPVFPFATGLFGKAHWNDALVKRWNEAHHSKGLGEGLAQLGPRWLMNPGYGAIGPAREEDPTSKDNDITKFAITGYLPSLWLFAAIGAGLLWKDAKQRNLIIALLVILSVQLLFWLFFTHHQARFLLPTLLPGCALAAMGIARIGELSHKKRPHLAPMVAVLWLLMLSLLSMNALFSQTIPMRSEDGRPQGNWPVWVLVDSLIRREDVTTNQPGRFIGMHPLNYLPPDSRVLIVGDASQLMYLATPYVYNSAFDRSLFADLMARHASNPKAVTAALAQLGVNYIWMDLSEIDRLEHSYGVDDALKLAHLTRFLQEAVNQKLWLPQGDVRAITVQPPKYLFRILAPVTRMHFTVPKSEDEKNEKKDAKTENE